MANSDKNIVIRPSIGSTIDQPSITFTGAGNTSITLKVLDDAEGTLSFEGYQGQVFAVDTNLSSGIIYSVNDISGLPLIDANADGTVRIGIYTGNVGIGTTLPTTKLDVVGDVLVTGSVTASSFFGNATSATYASTAGIATYASTAGIATSVIGGIASVTSLNVSGISTLGTVEISSGIITATSGVVTYYGDGSNLTELTGASAATYGDASTVAQIEVDANGRITNITEVAISGGGGGATDKIEEGNTKAEVIDTGSDGRFIVETEGVERLRINSTGNVGIGTDDPSAKLEVSTGSTSLFLVNDNVTDGNIFELNKSDGDLAFSVDATTGNVAIGQTEATSKLVVDGDVFISGILTSNNLSGTARFDAIGIGTDADTNIPLQVSTGSTVLFSVNDNVTDGVIFGINDVNSKSLFSVDADGTVLFRTSGNVGIGTTIVEPSSKLVVDGDVFITGVITSSNMSVDLTTFENINVNETVETQFLLVTGVSTFNNTITGTATTANNLSNAANITTGTINSARLTGSYDIDITGDAGTATTATNVTGAIGIGTAPDSNTPIQVSTGSTSLFLVNDNTSDGNIFELNKSDGDLAFAIDSVTGNVAIGQTEATSKLVVDGDVFISGILTSNNLSDTARFDAIGIGTDADLDIPLQVSTGSTVLFSVNDNVTDGVIFGINDANSKSLFSVDADGTVLFRTSGNVGIGTTIVEPSTKLVVDGDVSATDFNTTSDARLKTNIQVIGDPLKKVLQINGVSFNWIENNKPSLGVIADNIQEILPELVTDTNPKTVNYNGLIGLLIEVVKQQQDQINSLNDRVSRLE